jgi:ankyrin repeat protein
MGHMYYIAIMVKGQALFLAIENGHIDAVRLLIKHGADLTIRDKDRATYLHRAAKYGQDDIIELLLDSGMNINVTTGKCFQNNALTYAIRGIYGQGYVLPPVRTVNLLLDYGIDMYCEESFSSPLEIAIRHRNIDAVKALISRGYDLNRAHSDGKLPINWVSEIHIAKLLIEHGCNINQLNSTGMTPLHYAVMYKDYDVVRCFIELGADIGNINTTLTELAIQRGYNDEIIELIRDYERMRS